jgi:transcriptional regulator with XRE-family HTH domain
MVASFAGAMRALMTERGLSGRSLARHAGYDPAVISRVLNGQQRPSQRLAERLDAALGAGGELAALVPGREPWQVPALLSPDDAQRLEMVAESPSRVDAAALASLAEVLAAQRVLEDRIGSVPLLASADAHHEVVLRVAAAAPARLRVRALDLAAQYGYFRGWLHESAGHLRHAVLLYDEALGQAAETGSVSLASELISMKGHVAWQYGAMHDAIRLSRAARRDSGAFPGQHAIAALQEARAHGALGDAGAASALADTGADAVARAAEQPGERPPWLYYQSPGYFAVQIGRVWLHLSAHDKKHAVKALGYLSAGVDALDADARQSEWGGSYVLHVASAHVLRGDVAQACEAVREAGDTARRLNSESLLVRTRKMHKAIKSKSPGHPAVAALTESLR